MLTRGMLSEMLRVMNALARAIELVGGASKLARLLGAPYPSTVTNWMLQKRVVPAERCESIEAITEGAVTCEQLRPDLDWIRVNGRTFWRNKEQKAA